MGNIIYYINSYIFYEKTWINGFFYYSITDLDLDYLERRVGDTIVADNGSKEEESPADSLDRVKVIFLGAPGVGKSSIIRVRTI